MTTPTPTPAGRLARGEQRKGEEVESAESGSSKRPWRLSWREGDRGAVWGNGWGVEMDTASSLTMTDGGSVRKIKKHN